MTVSVSSFKIAYPSFVNAGDTLLTAQLAQVELEVSDGFAEQRDAVVMLLLADRLSSMPEGRDARMLTEEGGATSTYRKRYDELCAAYAVNALRFGVLP